MNKYNPIIAYCQERIKHLSAERDELEKPVDTAKLNNYVLVIDELFRIITLCQGMNETEKMLWEKLGLKGMPS